MCQIEQHVIILQQRTFILQAERDRCQTSDVPSSRSESGEYSAEADQLQHSSATKKRRTLTALHVDMNDTFWLERPHLLNGTK